MKNNFTKLTLGVLLSLGVGTASAVSSCTAKLMRPQCSRNWCTRSTAHTSPARLRRHAVCDKYRSGFC